MSTSRKALAADLKSVFVYGAISGVRSMGGASILSQRLAKRKLESQGRTLNLLSSEGSVKALRVLAGAEMLADKLPFVPARTQPISLLARAAAGAVVGQAVLGGSWGRKLTGALVGAGSALLATWGAFELRRFMTGRLRVPNFVAGMAEDFAIRRVARIA